MEHMGDLYISPNYSKDEYNNLKLTLNSSKNDWDKAIDMFSDRIYRRYIEQINVLLNNPKVNGFVIMAINCLLIETMLQFREGLDQSPRNQCRDKYSDFLVDNFPETFCKKAAERFYRDVRCGILHSAQTKGKTCLSTEDSYIIDFDSNNKMHISVVGISNVLQEYIEKYCIELVTDISNAETIELRENFIKKMDYICKR